MEMENQDFGKEVQSKFDTFCNLFSAMKDIIKELQVNDYMKSLIMKEFDTGFLWAREGFSKMAEELKKSDDSNVIVFNSNKDSHIA